MVWRCNAYIYILYPGSPVDYQKNGLSRWPKSRNMLHFSRSTYSLWTSRVYTFEFTFSFNICNQVDRLIQHVTASSRILTRESLDQVLPDFRHVSCDLIAKTRRSLCSPTQNGLEYYSTTWNGRNRKIAFRPPSKGRCVFFLRGKRCRLIEKSFCTMSHEQSKSTWGRSDCSISH